LLDDPHVLAGVAVTRRPGPFLGLAHPEQAAGRVAVARALAERQNPAGILGRLVQRVVPQLAQVARPLGGQDHRLAELAPQRQQLDGGSALRTQAGELVAQ